MLLLSGTGNFCLVIVHSLPNDSSPVMLFPSVCSHRSRQRTENVLRRQPGLPGQNKNTFAVWSALFIATCCLLLVGLKLLVYSSKQDAARFQNEIRDSCNKIASFQNCCHFFFLPSTRWISVSHISLKMKFL